MSVKIYISTTYRMKHSYQHELWKKGRHSHELHAFLPLHIYYFILFPVLFL
jgi:hypothetical protein